MLRQLYVMLVRLHPAGFRERFGGEMLEVFRRATGPGAMLALLADGLLSLVRQWVLRSEFRRPVLVGATASASANIPLFRTIDGYTPRPAAMLFGSVLTLAAIGATVGLIAVGAKRGEFLIGVHHPSAHLMLVDRASVAPAELNTTVKLGPDPEDPLRQIAAVYFKVVRVLYALDADHDLIISQWEMFTAPAALRRLDVNHDGKLSAEECGFRAGANPGLSPDALARSRREFMRVNPVLSALDSDHDGEISTQEIANSYSALKKLDRNGDGGLSADELLPNQQITQAATIMAGLDTNGDGVISRSEQESDDAFPFRDLLQRADRNHDGAVTREELRIELGRRAEEKRELDAARRAAGFR
jgi:Ca2+-binding EF-hand superfamily protein